MTALRCSFCNRTVNEVGEIISGPNSTQPVHICNQCVEVCAGILQDGTGEHDASKRFKVRRPIYNSLLFIIPVLIVVGVVFCVRAYFTGGMSHLEQAAVVWVVASAVAVLLGRWLRKLGQVNQ